MVTTIRTRHRRGHWRARDRRPGVSSIGPCVPAAALCLLAALASGCAAARFEAAHRTCDRSAEADPAAALGYAGPPAAGDLRGRAALNHAAAPPWVVDQSRVYPFDPGFRYEELWPAGGRASTPLLCRLTYDRTRRRGLFAADPLTQVELTTVYEVVGKTPPQRVHGPDSVPQMFVLDGVTAFAPGDVLRMAVVDRDVHWGGSSFTDDPLITFGLPYGSGGPLTGTSGAMWRGTVDVRCEHLDADAVQWAYVETLMRLDARLQRWAPQLAPGDWDFGLAGSGMTDLRAALERAASLRGWDAPEVRERTNRLLAAQLCFERAAAPEVERWARRTRSGRLGELELAATDYRCELEPSGACRLTVEITSRSDGLVSIPMDLRLVLAGGREVGLLPERATVAGHEVRDLAADSTTTVIYRVEVPLRGDHALTRPMLLRERRGHLFSSRYRVEDVPLRLAD
ncbi:hypothetical protein [Nannocystis punicea]|uniref:DUF3857 domain-containing protein n=1 Tax=Nannocystis punicea TaxID=2995304 RepID=A0ABY7GUS1_9BACT|nr:hypothetical protein [Nannocystis poenicansa]WAS90664.1 hypothetical protein O0S08_31135 [Nannocystis poenicansa]